MTICSSSYAVYFSPVSLFFSALYSCKTKLRLTYFQFQTCPNHFRFYFSSEISFENVDIGICSPLAFVFVCVSIYNHYKYGHPGRGSLNFKIGIKGGHSISSTSHWGVVEFCSHAHTKSPTPRGKLFMCAPLTLQ